MLSLIHFVGPPDDFSDHVMNEDWKLEAPPYLLHFSFRTLSHMNIKYINSIQKIKKNMHNHSLLTAKAAAFIGEDGIKCHLYSLTKAEKKINGE